MSRDPTRSPYTRAASGLLFRTCPRCAGMMRLWRIEPKLSEERVDTYFFECGKCSFASSEDIAREASAPPAR